MITCNQSNVTLFEHWLKTTDNFVISLADLGTTDHIQHEINTSNSPPVWQRCYLNSPQITREVNRQIDEQLRSGHIVESDFPWGAALIIARKPDGTIHLCKDYRFLNVLTTAISITLPKMTDIVDTMSMQQPSWLTLINMLLSYRQIKIHQNSIDKQVL